MRLPDQIVPDWVAGCVAAPFLIVASPALLAVAALVGIRWLKRKAIGPRNRWTRWFAWYPVDTGRGGKRWLETVERRSSHLMGYTYYRLSGPSA